MSLNKQVFLYSLGTDSFYDKEEQDIHKKLLRLYSTRNRIRDREQKLNKKQRVGERGYTVDFSWRIKIVNRAIKEQKEKMTDTLNSKMALTTPRQLNPDSLKDKSVISLFDSQLTRALCLPINKLTTDLMIVNVYFFQVFHDIVNNGFEYNGEKYVFLTASAGQIRTKRSVFIREKAFNQIRPKLMCGLTVEHINELGGINSNKFLAYLALMNSATDTWRDFDIDRSIVVDDFETLVHGEVDYIDDADYSITRKVMDTPIPHTDGCGMMLHGNTRMVRLPWVKGLLVKFPYDKFLKEKCTPDQWIVTDIYGMKHNIILEDIQYIFTKSQFKLYKYYKSWEQYKAYFKAYGCEAAYCNIEEAYIPKAKINYQMLQTLSDIKDDEIEKIVQPTANEINKVGADFQTNMRLLGATKTNTSPNNFQKGLILYPELFRDVYHREILKQTKSSLVKQAKGGRLVVNGRYQFLSPDLYAFCEWLFQGNMNPRGLLEDGEVYSSLNRNGDELACLRSPHLYREWAVRNNKRNDELDKWFGCTKCIYTSCHDLISRYLMFDVDGDKALVIKDKTLTNVAKRNMVDIRPLAYDLRKAKGGLLSNEATYEGMTRAYTGGNIGPISNNITKVWNSGEITQEQLNVVKWLCLYNNAVIDYAKTLWLPTPPKEINNIIKKYTSMNVPKFFIYAKDKEEHQVEQANNSAMNRISKSIPDARVKYCKTVGKFDYRMLMKKDADFTIKESPIIDAYNYDNSHQWTFKDTAYNIDNEDLYLYQKIREHLLSLHDDKDYIVNTIINYVYTVKKSSNKKLLWSVFGDEMVENLQENTATIGRICPICGKRFKSRDNANTTYCSDECLKVAEKQRLAGLYESPKVG